MEKKLSQKMHSFFIAAFVLFLFTPISAQWKTVRVGGGGATTSIQAHPLVQNLYFITTDVGTPYRWNSTTQAWEGLFYNFPPSYWNKNAAGNIAFDPKDATGNILYATIGGPWTNGTIMKSTDRGTNWTDCQLTLDVKPNNDQGYGQRLAVDPNNSNVVYVTTRSSTSVTAINGTFKSTSAGAVGSWTKINDLYGAFLLFDVSGGTVSGVTKNIYIGCSDGVYRSIDGGTSFALMSGSPINIKRAAIHSDGTLYVTHNAGVSKWNGSAWINVSPTTGNSYQAVDVNPNNSSQVIVGISSWSPYLFSQYVSNNGGTSWTKINPIKDNSEVPWFSNTIGQGLDDFCWDPFNQNMVWFSDFFDAHQTTNIWAGSNVTWKARAVGHEETVAEGNLLCPPSGVNQLLSNVADIGGWDHKSVDTSPAIGMMTFFPWTPNGEAGNMTGVAIQETNPNFIARVGRHGWSGAGYAGYSTNGGSSYTLWNCPSDAAGGRIAVSATSEAMVWATQSGPCYYSNNRGATWTVISTLPTEVLGGGSNVFNCGSSFPLAADKVNGNKFYLYKAGAIYVSTNGGSTFTQSNVSLPNLWYSNPLTVETTPGVEGDIWISMHTSGLYHSTNSGASFTQIGNVQVADYVSCGKASPSTPTIPALYVYGTVNNIANGLFRSNDNGATWETVSAPIKTGMSPYCMAADRQVYGRVFFGTIGNGLFYIDNDGSADTMAPTVPTGLSASNVTKKSFTLNWNSSTDNIAVSSYEVFINGTSKGKTNTTFMNITNLADSTAYSMTVKACDVNGNWSVQSEPFVVMTKPNSYPELTTIKVLPESVEVKVGVAVSLSAQGYDQYGDSIDCPITWSVNQQGTSISTSGSFTSNIAGTFTVTANSDTIVGTAMVTVTGSLTPYAIPGTIQAENYIDMFGLTIKNGSVGYVDAGDWIEYPVNVATAGIYSLLFHIASDMTTGACYFTIDGGASLGSFTCPYTGGWSIYKNDSINIELPNGLHTLRVNYTRGAFNTDYMVFTNSTLNDISPVDGHNENLMIYPSPVSDLLHLKGIDNFTKVDLYNAGGKLLNSFTVNKSESLNIDMSKYNKGVYMIQLVNSVDSKTKMIIKN